MKPAPIEILMVDDDPGDTDLALETLEEAHIALNLHAVHDGVEAMAYLYRTGPYATAERPHLILLDINMPKKDGREVLREIKSDPVLRRIPVIVLTTSDSTTDIQTMYELGASCYITKPVGLEQFARILQRLEDFWFMTVQLPHWSEQ